VRYVTPVAMQIECQNCHRARIGEILGVVSSEIFLQELDRNLRQRRNLLALVIISGVFLLSLFTFLALKRMVILPLQKIKKGVKEIASGDLKATISSLGRDEIGELGRGFEEMREKLARWGDELETKVKERTEALRKSEEAAQRLAQENALVAEVGRIINSTLNIDEVFERFSKAVPKLIPFDRIAINLISPQKDAGFVRYTAGIDVPSRRAGEYVLLEVGSATEECVRTKASLLIQPKDIKEIEEVLGRFPKLLPTFESGIRSIIMVPLIGENQVKGVLSLRSTKTKAYTDQDVRLAESIASQISGAIANSQLFAERMRAEEAREKLVGELQKALSEVKTLRGIFPICASCKKIRDDKGYWTQIEVYIRDRSEAEFSHGICPECIKKLYGDILGKKGSSGEKLNE